MKTFTINTVLFFLYAVAICVQRANAFHVHNTNAIQQRASLSTPSLHMSAEVDQDVALGATERLLLDRQKGLVQRLGKTVKKDGLDGVRAVVWSMYFGADYLFTGLGILLVLGAALNMAGYGYYIDHGMFNIDSLEHIRQDKFMAEEATKLLSK
mmetsp:Transcript_18730/g.28289  ORF Transcript_18730/g.28289 Transcript_18730/m.28289 type:complete len:154 (-) Transcript_18730:103-564(-)|eukprot:CAMPEP_0178915988 /NCGR_PEP_ID=MMETSP0786-20121207/12360_1 /TAXON_ID=186022 /ORGANISM="Thalassionema frauenfeldii, Strain CCMP 1798" /LENGTH=153 /DNA_ID=CAMNT_0020589215 /DNA_START=68 /DNA_END=529 /DNA_ORIENTATION=+